MPKHGFKAGPQCAVCHKETADGGEIVCYRCKHRLQEIDRCASNPRQIRADMMRTGVPVNGMEASFNADLRAKGLMRRRPHSGWATRIADISYHSAGV